MHLDITFSTDRSSAAMLPNEPEESAEARTSREESQQSAVDQVVSDGPGTPEQKQAALTFAMGLFQPMAVDTAARSANGDFFKILMELLLKFLPIILKLFAIV